jgi:hypothetical protein
MLKQFKRLYNFYFRISAIIFGKQSISRNVAKPRIRKGGGGSGRKTQLTSIDPMF